MNMIMTVIISVLIAGLVGASIGYLIRVFLVSGELRRSKDAADGQLRRAESRTREILVEAKENALQIRSDAQEGINNSLRDIQRKETQLETREENLRKQDFDLKRKWVKSATSSPKVLARAMFSEIPSTTSLGL